MDYDKLITTLSDIVENDKIYKVGLTLLYELDEVNHKAMNEDLYYRSNPTGADFKHSEEFEVVIEGITVRFVKAKIDL